MDVARILHIITSLDPVHGGLVQALRNYLPQLDYAGYHNEVVCLDDPKEPFIGKDDFIIHALGPSQRLWSYTSKLLPWLKNHLQEFDAVLVHGLWQYHGFAINKAIQWLKSRREGHVPAVFIMPHGMLDPYFQKAPERKLKAIRNIIYWKLIEEKVINNASALLFTCEEELRLAQQTFASYKPKDVINVGFGIAEPPSFSTQMAEAFAQHCPPAVKGRPFLLFLSRIHPKKGVDLLIKAYAELIKQKAGSVAESKAKEIPFLLIAGPGLETAYGQELQQLVKDLNLTHKVFFPGMLTGDAKWGAFYACDAFVLSSHQENFGIAVAEALACSKPVLISNQINIWREIKNAGAGLVEEDTLHGTVALLKQWTELPDEEKQKLSGAARTCYETNFAVKSAAGRLTKAILKTVEASKETA